LEAINLDFINSWIRPEGFKVRKPSAYSVPTALAGSTLQFTVTTNENGAAGVYIFPQQPIFTQTGRYISDSFATVLNGTTFDPITGLPGSTIPLFTTISSPLNSQYENIQSFMPNTMSV
jgi:hypothetical protein